MSEPKVLSLQSFVVYGIVNQIIKIMTKHFDLKIYVAIFTFNLCKLLIINQYLSMTTVLYVDHLYKLELYNIPRAQNPYSCVTTSEQIIAPMVVFTMKKFNSVDIG